MKTVGILENKKQPINLHQKQQLQRQNAKIDSINNNKEISSSPSKTTENKSPSRKWTSAFRVVQSMTRFRNLPKKHHYNNYYNNGNGELNCGESRGSSFSSSTESTPTRCLAINLDESEIIDPVYLALKQATCKYGNNSPLDNYGGGGGSKSGSRRGSQLALSSLTTTNNINNSTNQLLFESTYNTPSPRNLSQTSLQDSGYSGGIIINGREREEINLLGEGNNKNNKIGGNRPLLVSGSTPHLHGIGGNNCSVISTTNNNLNNNNSQQQLSPILGGTAKQRVQQQQQQINNNNTNQNNIGGGRRPKLSEKMKSLSLDCAEMPPPVQIGGLGRNQYFKGKPLRSARGYAASGDSFGNSFERSESPPSIRPTPPNTQQQQLPRRLPPAPPQLNNSTIQSQQQQTKLNDSSSRRLIPPIGTHIVIHEYINGDCNLFLGDRLVVLDNGDPDWKHGFKVNDRLQQLFTFPSTCITAFQPDEQPMRLTQNCNLIEQKLRLYRDQVVFAQPNSLREDGRVNVRNEHGTCAYCPLQYLVLM